MTDDTRTTPTTATTTTTGVTGTDDTATASSVTSTILADPVATLRDVTYAYTGGGRPALDAVSVAIEAGEFCGIVGPNGSGKSTLLKLLLGLLAPDRGSAELFGEPATRFAAGERVGYVAQNPTVADGMAITVEEVVRMGRYPRVGFGRLGADDERAVERALLRVDIADIADRRIGHLSGGQRQRVFVARALCGGADLLVLDEPAAGVDADSRERLYALLRDLGAGGLTVVLVEHDLGLVVEHADRLVWLDRRVRYDGPPEAFVRTDALAEAYGANRRPSGRDAA